MNITELFGKQIYSLYEGEMVGTIAGANFNKDLNKIYSFKIFDSFDNEAELLYKDIKAMSSYVVIANKSKLLTYFETPSKNPFFKEVIDDAAKSLGKIVNAKIDENGNIINYITDKQVPLTPKNIIIRKDFVFYTSLPKGLYKYKPKTNKIETSAIKVNILYSNQKTEKIVPPKLSFNPNLVLGKLAKSDLMGKNNELIIKANQQITEKTIEEASRHNCLNQLFYIAI